MDRNRTHMADNPALASVTVLVECHPHAESICAKHDPSKYVEFFNRIQELLSGRHESPIPADQDDDQQGVQQGVPSSRVFALNVSVEAVEATSSMVATLARAAVWLDATEGSAGQRPRSPSGRASPSRACPSTSSKSTSISASSSAAATISAAVGCRTGAFEVYLLIPDALVALGMGRVPPCIGLHSKLRSRRWPSVQRVAQRCAAALLPIFERQHADSSLRSALHRLRMAHTAGEREDRLVGLRRAIDMHRARAGFGLIADLACVERDATAVVQAHRARVAADARLRHAMEVGQSELRHAMERERYAVSAPVWAEAQERLVAVTAADNVLRQAIDDALADHAASTPGATDECERSDVRLGRLRQGIEMSRLAASKVLVAEAEGVLDDQQEKRSLSVLARCIASQRLRRIIRLRAVARAIVAQGKQISMSTFAGEARNHTHAPSRWHSLALLQAMAETESSYAFGAKLERHRVKARPEIVSSARLWMRMLEARERAGCEKRA